MALLLNLLVLVVLAGLAARFGFFDTLRSEMREAALARGADPGQTEHMLQSVSDLSLGGFYELAGSLPPPYGALARLLLTLLIAVFVASLLFGLVRAVLHAARWFRDFFI